MSKELGPTEVRIDGEVYDTAKDYYKLEDLWGMPGVKIEGLTSAKNSTHTNSFSDQTKRYLERRNGGATRTRKGEFDSRDVNFVLPKSDR